MTRTKQPLVEGARSISVWWTIVTAIITACLCAGFTWGSSQSRMDRQDRDIAQIQQNQITDRSSGAESLKGYRDDTRTRFDKLNVKIDKEQSDIVQLIRVTTRVAAKVGVSDE